MKSSIGPNDAIDNEVASSAYLENFALKIFSVADNEDRSGHAKRTTAKKFLAAANFLEVLKIFPKPDSLDTVCLFHPPTRKIHSTYLFLKLM